MNITRTFRINFFILFLVLAFFTGCVTGFKKSEEDATLRLKLGQSYLSKKNYPLALKELLEAERLNPKDPNVHASLGLVYFARERYELSEKHFLVALKLKPDFTDAKNNLATTYISLNKLDKAEPLLQDVLKDLLYVDYHRAYYQYGILEFKKENYSAALSYFKKAIVKDASCYSHTYLGRTYTELGNYQMAIQHLEAAQEPCRNAFSDEDLFYLAIAHYRNQQKQRATELFELCIKTYPNGLNAEKARQMLEIVKKEF